MAGGEEWSRQMVILMWGAIAPRSMLHACSFSFGPVVSAGLSQDWPHILLHPNPVHLYLFHFEPTNSVLWVSIFCSATLDNENILVYLFGIRITSVEFMKQQRVGMFLPKRRAHVRTTSTVHPSLPSFLSTPPSLTTNLFATLRVQIPWYLTNLVGKCLEPSPSFKSSFYSASSVSLFISYGCYFCSFIHRHTLMVVHFCLAPSLSLLLDT